MTKKRTHVFATLPDMPAYPLDPGTGADDPYNGLSKREYFAACALRGLATDVDDTHLSDLAHDAVRLADLLIEALNTVTQNNVTSVTPSDVTTDDTEPVE